MESLDTEQYNDEQGIAIVGMAGRFPKAKDLTEFWNNLYAGVECISHFSDEELASWGIPADKLKDTNFVPAKGMLEGADLFDAAFFGYSPREAELLDPQQRLFLECAWQALEDAGYDPHTYPGLIGVYAGLNMNTYYPYILWNMFKDPALRETIDTFQLMLANDKDYLTTRVSYKLNLRGPSINVQTACSTSLVAVHLACQSLLNGECDMALAGGVAVHAAQRSGYSYQEGSISSPDGHCRAFDANAQGTLSGNGLGIVVLKRLADAITDRDTIHAVIKGTACNNDGALKIGYTAPSVQGQAAVIAEAQSMADVPAETIGYIEAHGTATPLGDPIEIAALTQAFRIHTTKKSFIPVGSVKTNLGHLGAAAGIAGLLKTVLALKHQTLPPSLHFKEPNPQIDFANSPFYVNSERASWRRHGAPLRAGVSSFGIGGTNAHLILEEAPIGTPTSPAQPWQLIVLSAKTASALDQARHNLAQYLRENSAINLADVAYTLQVGRSLFNHRFALVCRDVTDACRELSDPASQRVMSLEEESINRQIAFLFPGQGSQYVRMGQELYQTEPLFRAELDRCATLLHPYLQRNILTILYPDDSELTDAAEQLAQTSITQPVLFALEYALAKLWEAWGIQPHVMIGHSIGEYVAACLAGVFSLAEALKLVSARGRLMQTLDRGAMLAIQLTQPEIEQLLTALDEHVISIAAVNSPNQCTVSGPLDAIAALEQQLSVRAIEYRRLKTSHAFHSTMTEPILTEFGELVASIPLQAPQKRFISNVTGTWITAEQATDPQYWTRHLRQTVHFADGIQTLLREPNIVLLEVGPGRTLSTFAKQQKQTDHPPITISSLRRETEDQSDTAFLLASAGRLWLHGVKIAWQRNSTEEQRQRIPLPTYPFERQRYWIEPSGQVDTVYPSAATATVERKHEQEQRKKAAHPRPFLTNAYVAPRNESEQRIADIWGKLLGIDEVGIYDNFFDLGGHSLLATQVVSRLRTELHVEFPLRKLLEQPTVAEVASLLAEMQRKPEGDLHLPAFAAVTHDEREKPSLLGQTLKKREGQPKTFPLSFAQQRLWFLDQLEPGNTAYIISLAIHMKGSFHLQFFAQSVQDVIQRHDSLRTTFTSKDEKPVQVISPKLSLMVPVVDLSSLSEQVRFSEAEALVNAEGQLPFDLTRGPLLRTTLLRLENDSYGLLLSMHHIISDAWSLNVLLGEIFTLYEAYRQDKPSPLAPLPLQYADFALWQRQWLQGEVLQTQIDYWKQQLRGATPVSLPTDHPRPLIQTNHGARLTFELPTDLSNQLQALSREQDCTLFMTLLAAFQLLLSRYTGQTDIVVGTDIANRTHIETEQLIGFFINLLPLRTKLQSTATFSTILRQVRETVLDAYTHQDLPFDMLVDLLRLERRSNEIPLVRVLFVLQNAPRAQLEFSSLKFASFMGERMTAKFEIALFMWQGSRGLQGLVIYNTDLFNASTIKNMTDHFAVLLRKLIAHFDEPVKTLDISTEEEKMQKIEEKKRRIDNKMDKLKSKKSEEIYSVAKNDLLLQ